MSGRLGTVKFQSSQTTNPVGFIGERREGGKRGRAPPPWVPHSGKKTTEKKLRKRRGARPDEREMSCWGERAVFEERVSKAARMR